MPLLLQAGFSLSPKASGVIVTPILVGITIGSIINGRILVRIKHTRFIYSAGVLLLIVGLLMLTQASQAANRVYLALACAFCGLGFGYQIPNLTLQMQASVARADLGASSALVQTLRTVGSMFGASLGGLFLNLSFTRAMNAHLNDLNITDDQVKGLFNTPQILVREIDQAKLFDLAKHLGIDANSLLEQSRLNLISGVHLALWVAIIIAGVAIYLSFKLPNMTHIPHVVQDTLAETPDDYL
jgi:MFS family permease